jgi:hypothetical protein
VLECRAGIHGLDLGSIDVREVPKAGPASPGDLVSLADQLAGEDLAFVSEDRAGHAFLLIEAWCSDVPLPREHGVTGCRQQHERLTRPHEVDEPSSRTMIFLR